MQVSMTTEAMCTNKDKYQICGTNFSAENCYFFGCLHLPVAMLSVILSSLQVSGRTKLQDFLLSLKLSGYFKGPLL